mgnify:CR=1 FL=1
MTAVAEHASDTPVTKADERRAAEKQYDGDAIRVERRMSRFRFQIPTGASFHDVYADRNSANIAERVDIALEAIEQATGERDVNTIGFFTGVWLTNPLVAAEAKVALRDLTTVARLVLEPAVIAVKADAPFKTLKDFIDEAKRAPGTLKQSGGSITSRDNVVRQLLQKHTGAQWAYISFPGGGERISALLGGHIDVASATPGAFLQLLEAKKIRFAGVASPRRLGGPLAVVPTLREQGFDVVASTWFTIFGPKGISAEQVAYWEDVFFKAMRHPEAKKFADGNNWTVELMGAKALRTELDKEYARLRKTLTELGLVQ